MQTKSYLRTEVTNLFTEASDLDNWKLKCEELGLNGQLDLTKTTKSPIPFPLMTTEEKNIYNTLFDREVSIEKYNKEPIPLDLLSLVALSKQENYFDKGIYIQFSDEVKDPIIKGKKQDTETSWNTNEYIIGRWGDVLLDIPSLRKKAAEKKASLRAVQLEKVKASLQSCIDNVEKECYAFMMGNEITETWYLR